MTRERGPCTVDGTERLKAEEGSHPEAEIVAHGAGQPRLADIAGIKGFPPDVKPTSLFKHCRNPSNPSAIIYYMRVLEKQSATTGGRLSPYIPPSGKGSGRQKIICECCLAIHTY